MIKKYKQFLEAISGTIDTMPFGPGFPRQELRPTLTQKDTETIYSDITGKFYTINDYNELYEEYLKKHPEKPLTDGFTKENLEKILTLI